MGTKVAVVAAVVSHALAAATTVALAAATAVRVVAMGHRANTCNVICNGKKACSLYCNPRLPTTMQLLLSCW